MFVSVLGFLMLAASGVAWAQDGIVNARGNWTIYPRNMDNEELVTKHVQIHQVATRYGGSLKARTSQD